MKNSLHLFVRYPVIGLAIFGMAGAALVWAAPKINKKPMAPPKKSTAAPTKAAAATKPATRSKSGATNKVQAPVKTTSILKLLTPKTVAPRAQQGGDGQVTTTQATEFTPSHYPGVMVRNMPQASPQQAAVDTSKGPILYNERPAPGGGMMADIAIPREVETVPATDQTDTEITPTEGGAKPLIAPQPAAKDAKPAPKN